jgi:SAM-dependent methyltransferase
MKKVENYYGDYYFNFHQKKIGEFGANANMFKFIEFVKLENTVLDFGCGGGFLLNNLNCKKKIGIEINQIAREVCLNFGIDCFSSLDEVEDNSVDLIISNNCLEHTESPCKIIETLYSKLVTGGKIVIVVPCDRQSFKFVPNDINNHFYSFSPMNLGNLLQNAGFEDIKVKNIYHKWIPIPFLAKYFGFKIFHFSSRIYGYVNRSYVQVRGEGVKK